MKRIRRRVEVIEIDPREEMINQRTEVITLADCRVIRVIPMPIALIIPDERISRVLPRIIWIIIPKAQRKRKKNLIKLRKLIKEPSARLCPSLTIVIQKRVTS